MSCSVCHGHPGCPACQSERNVILKPCENCWGTGIKVYFNTNGDEILPAIWEALPFKEREQDYCEACDGTGEREYENEYEYDYNEL